MSEQPKPLSAEEVVRLRSLLDKPHATIFRDEFEAIIATLDAERARADAAERDLNTAREVNKATLLLAESSERAAEDRIAAATRKAVAAEKSCEEWQECAGNLALALKNQFHEESRTDEMREALAEFDRLASEATKGVEF